MSDDSGTGQTPSAADAYLRLPSRSLNGVCLIALGAGLLLYMCGRLGHPNSVEPLSILWVGAIVAISVGVAWVVDPKVEQGSAPAAASGGRNEPPAPAFVEGQDVGSGGRALERLRSVGSPSPCLPSRWADRPETHETARSGNREPEAMGSARPRR